MMSLENAPPSRPSLLPEGMKSYPNYCHRSSSFLGVAEGLIAGVAAGVEEVTAIATLQAILGAEHARAKLVRLPQVSVWQWLIANYIWFSIHLNIDNLYVYYLVIRLSPFVSYVKLHCT